MKVRVFFLWAMVIVLTTTAANAVFAQPRVIKGIYYIKQTDRNYCGPAALAMLMNYWSKEKRYNQLEIVDAIFDKNKKVVYNSDMVYYAKQEGLICYSFNSNIQELKLLIDKGIPLIVLQKPIKQINKGHYRVVFGYDDDKGVFILHDPLIGANRGMKYKDFQELWNFGDNANRQNWTLAVFPKDKELPFPELKDNYIYHINMATAYYRKKNYQDSIAEWEWAIEKCQDDPLPYPYYCLAQVLLDIDRTDEAIKYALKAVEIDHKNPFAYDVLGLAYNKNGMIMEATETMAKAAKLRKKEHSFILKHWLKIRDKYINMFKKEKNKDEGEW